MANEPIADVVARVLGPKAPVASLDGMRARNALAASRRDARILARAAKGAAKLLEECRSMIDSYGSDLARERGEVERLTVEVAKEQMERSDAEHEIERLRAIIEDPHRLDDGVLAFLNRLDPDGAT